MQLFQTWRLKTARQQIKHLVASPETVFCNLSIRDKLSFGFGTLVTLTFLVVGFSFLGSLKATFNINQTRELRMPAALTSAEAQTSLIGMSSNVRGYLATGQSEFRDLYQHGRQAFQADLAQLNTLLEQAHNSANINRLREVQSLYEKWITLPDRLFSLRDNQLKNQPALKILHEQGEVPIAIILAEVTQMLQEQEKQPVAAETANLLKELVDFKSSFALQVSALRGYVTTRNPSFRFEYVVNSKANAASWEQLKRFEVLLTPTQQASLKKITQARQLFLPVPAQMFAAADSDRYREDLFLFQSEAKPLADRMAVLLHEIVSEEQAALTSELQVSTESLIAVQAQTVAVSVIALTLAISLALILRRQIADPIKRLTHVTTRIIEGDLTARATVESSDETGILAATFNRMTDSLQHSREVLQEYSHTLEHRVEERTQELQQKNEQLGQTLQNLQQAQTQLIQTEKMSSLGQLVAGVAHEINNPVNFIHGNTMHANQYIEDLLELLQLYQNHYPQPAPEIEDKAEEIDLEFLRQDLPKVMVSMKVGTDRIRDIVQSLRVFSRLDEAEVKEVNIHEGIDSTIMILHHRLKAQPDRPEIQIIREYGNLPKVECYAGQLNQVFMNILSNAIDALEESSSKNSKPEGNGDKEPDKAPTIHIRTETLGSDWVAIHITDNGPGIPQSVQKQLFDPFFTTKPVGKGTGLGMSISHQIVTDKHGGFLTCHSELGKGAEFIIQIPIHQQLQSTPVAV